MSAIEEKVVSFRANIGDFKSKMIDTLNIFNRVNSGLGKGIKLDTKNAENGLKSFNATANNVSLEKIQNGVERLNERFSTMGIVGMTAISNIATAVQTKLAGAIDAMLFRGSRDGFAEYESEINSLQTIMANVKRQGYGMDDVKKSMANLNEYADKTIYSLADMQRNMGTFTAAGVDLKRAEVAIIGMSNAAAGAGANTEQLGRAMYQTSQALGKGFFQTIDWSSIDNASMGTAAFKEQIIQTAEAMGKLEKGTVTVENFRASLEKKKGEDTTWLTSDVFITAMEKMSQDQELLDAATKIKTFGQLNATVQELIGTGWATTWRLLLGDFDQARYFFTTIGNLITGYIGRNAEARNSVLKEWSDQGGTSKLLSNLHQIIHAVVAILDAFDAAFTRAFPKEQQVKMLHAFNDALEKFGRAITPSAQGLEDFAQGLGGLIKFGANMIKIVWEIAKAFSNLFPKKLVTLVFEIFKGFKVLNGELTDSSYAIQVIRSMGDAFKHVSNFLDFFIEKAIQGVQFIRDIFPKVFADVGQYMRGFNFENAFNFLKIEAPKDNGQFENFFKGLQEHFEKFKMNMQEFQKWWKNFWKSFFDFLSGTKQEVGKVLGYFQPLIRILGEALSWLGEQLKGITFRDVLNVFMAIGAYKFGTKLTESINSVGDAIQNFLPKITIQDTRGPIKTAIAIAALAVALGHIQKLDATGLAKSVVLLSATIGAIALAMNSFSKVEYDNGAEKAMKSLNRILITMAISFFVMKGMSPEQMTSSALAMAGIIGAVTLSMLALQKLATKTRAVNKDKRVIKSGLDVLKEFSKIVRNIGISMLLAGSKSPEQITTASLSIVAIITGLTFAAKHLDKVKVKKESIYTLYAFSTSILLLSIPMMLISLLPWNNIIKATFYMGAMLATLALATKALDKIKVRMESVAMVGALSVAMLTMTIPLVALAFIPSIKILKSLFTMIAIITTIGIFVKALSKIKNRKDFYGIAAIIAALGAALLMLTLPIAILGALPWQVVAGGLIAVAAGLLVIGGVAGLVGKFLGDGLMKFGQSMLYVGAAAFLFGLGFKYIVAGFGAFILLAGGIVGSAVIIGKAFEVLIDIFVSLSVKIGLAGAGIIVGLVEGIVSYRVRLFKAGIDLILGFAETLLGSTARLVTIGVQFITEILKGLTMKASELVYQGTVLIITTLNGMAKAIGENSDLIIGTFGNIIKALIIVVLELLTKIPFIGDMFKGSLNSAKADLEQSTNEMNELAKKRANNMGTNFGTNFKTALNSSTAEMDEQMKKWGLDLGAGGSRAGANFAAMFHNGLNGDERNTMDKFRNDVITSDLPALFNALGVKSKDEFITKANEIDLTTLLTKLQTQIGEANLKNVLQQFGIDNISAIQSLTPEAQDKLRAFLVTGIITTEPEARQEAKDAGVSVGQGFTEGVQETAQQPVEAMDEIQANMRETVDLSSFNDLGRGAVNQFSSGVDSGAQGANNAGINVANNAQGGFRSVSTYGAGLNFVDGAESGIHSGRSRLFNAAASVARSALSGFNQTLEIRSPSRVMKRSGHWFVQGVVEGIGNSSHNAYDKVKTLGEQMIDTVNNTMDNLVSENLYEFETTIIPTLDTSSLNAVKLNGHVNDVNFQNLKIAYDKLNNQLGSSQVAQTTVKIQNENRGLLDGAVFHVREEADIEKFAVEIDRRMRLQSDISKIIGRANI